MQKQSQPNEEVKRNVPQLIKEFKENKNQAAQEQLVQIYKPLVESLTKKYSKAKHYYEDIFQVGMVGLLAAIQRYDESYGKSFEAYAVPTIIGEIKRFLRDKTWSVHVPRKIKELNPKINTTIEELTLELQRSPTIKEISERIDVSEEEVLEALEIGKGYHALSVDFPLEADSDGREVTLLDIVGKVDEGYEKVNQRLVLEKVLHVLTERERIIIQYTFLENMSQKECGEKLGISQMHVSRLQRRAINKLKMAIHPDDIKSEYQI